MFSCQCACCPFDGSPIILSQRQIVVNGFFDDFELFLHFLRPIFVVLRLFALPQKFRNKAARALRPYKNPAKTLSVLIIFPILPARNPISAQYYQNKRTSSTVLILNYKTKPPDYRRFFIKSS